VDGWQIILTVLVVGLVALGLMLLITPRFTIRFPIALLLSLLYRKQVIGLENIPKDQGCVVVSNHVSWIDGVLLLWMLPRNIRFIVDKSTAQGIGKPFRHHLDVSQP
jgi:acyl-[acyl-carrier-protein]-phospholipid O-acyltransferase/long-chain-fatty-acid--[acyl-carrier-protein] ligase